MAYAEDDEALQDGDVSNRVYLLVSLVVTLIWRSRLSFCVKMSH